MNTRSESGLASNILTSMMSVMGSLMVFVILQKILQIICQNTEKRWGWRIHVGHPLFPKKERGKERLFRRYGMFTG